MKAHTLILGIGNPLMADDGAGVQVIELLRRESLPAGIRVQDGGTAGVGLVPEMEGHQRLILVDCATMGERGGDEGRQPTAQAGQWRRFTLEETRLLSQEASALSLHNAPVESANCVIQLVNVTVLEIAKQVLSAHKDMAIVTLSGGEDAVDVVRSLVPFLG